MNTESGPRPRYEPADSNFAARVREDFARQRAMVSMGIGIHALGPGWIDLEFAFDEAFTQQDGYLHAGMIATALDSACGYAAMSLTPPGTRVLTAEYKINLLRPARGASFVAAAVVVKPGRTLTVTQATLHVENDNEPLAIMTGTIMALR